MWFTFRLNSLTDCQENSMKKLCLAILLMFCFVTTAFAEVNLNTASKEELSGLPGIGPVKAESIIKYREEKGPFKSIDELKNVYGIGDKTFARLKSEISVDTSTTKVTTAQKTETTSATSVTQQQATPASEEKTTANPSVAAQPASKTSNKQ
jgi:competence protein ComEA